MAVTTTSIFVNWTDPDATFASIKVTCIGRDGALNETVVVPSGGDSECQCDGLTPGALYDVTLSTQPIDGGIDPAEVMLHNVITGRLNHQKRYMCVKFLNMI